MKKITMLCVLLSLVGQASCMHSITDLPMPLDSYRQVENKEITHENIFTFNEPSSQKLKDFVQELTEDKHDLFYQKVCLGDTIQLNSKAINQFNSRIRSFFKKIKASNHSGHNIVCNYDGYCIKMAGPSPRLLSMVHKLGMADQKPPLEIKNEKTFLTAGMFAYHVRLKDSIKAFGLKHITVPNSYLVRLKPADALAHDENCFIAQEKIDQLYPLSECPGYLTDEMIGELNVLIQKVGGVHFCKKIYYHQEQKKLYIFGIKDNLLNSKADFFNPTKEILIKNINDGLYGLTLLQKKAKCDKEDEQQTSSYLSIPSLQWLTHQLKGAAQFN